jgi:hypothetical protein
MFNTFIDMKQLQKIEVRKDINSNIIEEITKSIQQIKYGEVVITIHNSKVVQVEKREKKRFQD